MSKEIYGYIYKTILPDGRYYIGQSRGSKIRPNYFGSGTYMLKYLSSHSAEDLELIVVEWVYGSQEDLNTVEARILGDKYKKDPLCVNLQPGGNQAGASDDFREKMRIINTGRKASEETRKKLSMMRTGEGNSFYGKKHTEETKAKMRKPKVSRKVLV